jgi:hypothetical protein
VSRLSTMPMGGSRSESPEDDAAGCTASSGGRAWWAHFEFTRINTTPTFLSKKIEERRTLGAFFSDQWFESPRTVN